MPLLDQSCRALHQAENYKIGRGAEAMEESLKMAGCRSHTLLLKAMESEVRLPAL